MVRIIIGLGFVLLALFPMPYGYYQLLRIVFFILVGSYLFAGIKTFGWEFYTIAGVALLYNPIFPIHLGSKLVWTIVNIATMIFVIYIERKHIKSV